LKKNFRKIFKRDFFQKNSHFITEARPINKRFESILQCGNFFQAI